MLRAVADQGHIHAAARDVRLAVGQVEGCFGWRHEGQAAKREGVTRARGRDFTESEKRAHTRRQDGVTSGSLQQLGHLLQILLTAIVAKLGGNGQNADAPQVCRQAGAQGAGGSAAAQQKGALAERGDALQGLLPIRVPDELRLVAAAAFAGVELLASPARKRRPGCCASPRRADPARAIHSL